MEQRRTIADSEGVSLEVKKKFVAIERANRFLNHQSTKGTDYAVKSLSQLQRPMRGRI
jgi:hypothetical protein